MSLLYAQGGILIYLQLNETPGPAGWEGVGEVTPQKFG